MPNVVVYVPAAAWRRLEQRGLDPAEVVREFAKRGYEMTGSEVASDSPRAASDESGAAPSPPAQAAPELPSATGSRVVDERSADLRKLAEEASAPATATPQAPQSSGVGAATPSPAAPPGAEDSFKPDFKKEKPKRTGFRK